MLALYFIYVDAFMHITSEMKLDLLWWIENIYAQVRIIARGNPDITMQTDASMIGWGCCFGK
jgi:hypothetical protein